MSATWRPERTTSNRTRKGSKMIKRREAMGSPWWMEKRMAKTDEML